MYIVTSSSFQCFLQDFAVAAVAYRPGKNISGKSKAEEASWRVEGNLILLSPQYKRRTGFP